MSLNLDAIERAAMTGQMKWRDVHALVSLTRQLLRLRAAARDFFNNTVATPSVRVSASTKHAHDRALKSGERLHRLLEATAPGARDRPARVDAIAAHSPFDVEAMMEACIPGGSVCDPQCIADAIREYVAALASRPENDADSNEVRA